MAHEAQPRRRCAVYTRKSSEEGLEQSFNSLDAQQEACEAYIRSQKHEGWRSAGSPYDDGGYSGGSMDRPDLQRLLADIEAGKIDIIVVYKVDRLTRSLMDFAKMVEMFDRKGVSFVSVTQQFSTTTSMGRLTLNMLLSFAQFEREVTGERIRDKIAASKRKGLWMGGLPPLGYDPDERTLKINEAEAATVRTVFDLYRRFGNVARVKEESDRLQLRTKRREWSNGKVSGCQPLNRGHIYHLLSNPIYIGMITHKGELYKGQHTAIIDQVIWNAVRALMSDQTSPRQQHDPNSPGSLLTGLIFDDQGERLTPTSARKGSKRYRYYVSRALITAGRPSHEDGMRIPAEELDMITVRALRTLLQDRGQMLEYLPQTPWAADMIERAAERADALDDENTRSSIVSDFVVRATISSGQLRLTISLAALDGSLPEPPSPPATPLQTIELSIPIAFRRRNGELKLIIPDGRTEATTNPDQLLVRLIMRAQAWLSHLKDGGTVKQIAQANRLTTSFVSRTVRLAFLAPDIVESIFDGKQPPDISVTRLLADSDKLPFAWSEQRRMLGFSPLGASRI